MEQKDEKSFQRPSFSGFAPGHMLISIVVNLACPYILANELSQRGLIWQGLLLALLFPIGCIIYTWVRTRVVDVLGVGVIVVLLGNLLVQLLAGSLPNYHLFQALRLAGPVAFLGLATLLSQGLRRPLLYYADRFFSAGENKRHLAQYDAVWERGTRYRATLHQLNLIWGCAQLLLAGLVTALLFLLPDWPELLSLFVLCVGYVALALWTQQHKQRWIHTQSVFEEE